MPGTSSVTLATTRVATPSTPGIAAMRGARRDGARLSDANTSAKRARLVVRGARPLQRVEVRQVHDEHRHAGGDHRGDRQRLPLHLPQIAQQLAVERRDARGHPHHGSSATATFVVFALDAGDAAVGEADDAVGHAGDGRVVRDDDRGGAELAVDALERLEHDDAGRDVERAGRLVAQQHVGPLGDRARDGDALLLAAGELRRESDRGGGRGRPGASASSGVIGCSAISVTSATFSRAVRLGIRL